MVVIVASVLSFVSMQLQPRQNKNLELNKKVSILAAMNIESTFDNTEQLYEQYITESYVIDHLGNRKKDIDAFAVKLKDEIRKDSTQQHYPVYNGKINNKHIYIIPLRGKGLWGPIWGYIALEEDFNTVYGVTFDHAGETPGLGGEIRDNTEWKNQFKQKKIMKDGRFVSLEVKKGGVEPGYNHGVDAISGATITSKGVEKMIGERLSNYQHFFNKKP
jgi:Na+-transporting NADH:ubiquinone oxidoreductase subunit C